jgi:hypothetical protein
MIYGRPVRISTAWRHCSAEEPHRHAAHDPHFSKVLSSLITEKQGQRIQQALATLQ